MVSDSLDITQELLGRYGGLMAVQQHEVLQDALLPLLDEQRGGLRKRAISGLGAALLPGNIGLDVTSGTAYAPRHDISHQRLGLHNIVRLGLRLGLPHHTDMLRPPLQRHWRCI